MAKSQVSKVIEHLRSAALVRDGAEPTDGQLLDRFLKEREPAALETLVRRHAPMVWGVCRRILGNHHDTEDAFQASFLVLVRKAASIKPRDMVGNWLYGVARQTASKARAVSARHQAREKMGSAMIEPAIAMPESTGDLCQLLDAELARLPDKYRAVLVMCELESKSLKEAARQLGLPAGTIASRLARGRSMLAKRMARHGPAVSAVALTGLLVEHAGAASLPAGVLASAIQAAALTASGQTAVGLISTNAVALAEAVMKTVLITKLTKLTAVVLLTLACCGAGYLAHRSLAAEQDSVPQQIAEQKEPAKPKPDQEAAAPAPKDGANDKQKPEEKKPEEKKEEKKTSPRGFTVGKETTFALGPLDKDGRIDYETALNEILGKGVTPENNANVLMFKAYGPHPDGAAVSDRFFEWMKIPVPPEKGDYFVRAGKFVAGRKFDAAKITKYSDGMENAMRRPWTAEEYPDVADWIKINEKPLAVVIEASKRTHYYYPLVTARKNGKTEGLMHSLIPGVQGTREFVAALTARAMLRVSQKRYDEAWQDLIACHRLGRLVGKTGTFIEGLCGLSLDASAREAELAFLDAAKLDGKKLKVCLRDLQELPPMPSVADKMELTERFMALESVMLVERDGLSYVDRLQGGKGTEDTLTKLFGKSAVSGADWDTALRNINKLYDRFAAAMRMEDRKKRSEKIMEIEMEVRDIRISISGPQGIATTILKAKSFREAKGKIIGDLTISWLTPTTVKVLNAYDRQQQNQRNLLVAFALATYKADNGRYPKTLDALAPNYLAAIPGDLFSGKTLIYRLEGKGYLLYSVGVNGRDDQGRTQEENAIADDLRVRMPIPK